MPKIIPENIRKRVVDLYLEGMGSPTISKTLNITKKSVLRILKERNVNTRSGGRYYIGGKSETDKEFIDAWSLQNLRPMWGSENMSKNNKIIAHQYKIRQERESEERKNIEFDINKVDIKKTIIKKIDRKTCEDIIIKYEWLGYLPKFTKFHYGLYFIIDDKEYLGGVLAYQTEYANNRGVWDKYGFTNIILQLSRGVCLWWTPKNSASYFISRVNNIIKKETHYKVITATTDSSAGEIGTIYQALNWYYCGSMDSNKQKNGNDRVRYGYIINGKIYSQRHLRKMIGTAKRNVVLEKFPNVKIINLGRKKRYFTFIGSKKENKKFYKAIEKHIKKYPKR